MERRSFLTGSLAGAAWAAGGKTAGAAEPGAKTKTPEAKLNICSQETRVSGKTLREKLEKLAKWGAVGVEIIGRNLPTRTKEITDALKATGIKLSAICGGYSGVLISSDKADRDRAVATMKDTLSIAGDLGAVGVIAVPAFNRHKQLVGKEARAVLVDLLGPLGEHAHKAGTRVLLEPLNRKEAYFLRQLADAASICRDAGSPGAAMMGDFYHMYIEETSDQGAVLSGGKYLHHMHLGSIKRKLPGQDARSFVDGFVGLKRIGYQGFVSLECGCIGNRDVETPKSFRFLEKQWAQATL